MSTDPSPTITAMLNACGQDPSRFLLELQRQRAALMAELRTGLKLSRNQSPRLHSTIRNVLTEAIGPDPRWIRSLSGLVAVFDAYVRALELQYFGTEPDMASLPVRFPDLFTRTDIQHAVDTHLWCLDNLSA